MTFILCLQEYLHSNHLLQYEIEIMIPDLLNQKKNKEIFVLKFIIIKGFLLIKIRGQINL